MRKRISLQVIQVDLSQIRLNRTDQYLFLTFHLFFIRFNEY